MRHQHHRIGVAVLCVVGACILSSQSISDRIRIDEHDFVVSRHQVAESIEAIGIRKLIDNRIAKRIGSHGGAVGILQFYFYSCDTRFAWVLYAVGVEVQPYQIAQ